MQQKIKTFCLILIIVGLFSFNAQPAQAGFWDWLKELFTKDQTEEILPASVSEPIEEILSSEEEQQEILEEVQPEITSEAPEEITGATTVVEKIIYKDNPEQEITIQNFRSQVTSLQNQIKNLEQQIEDLLSGSPEIKIITNEVPIEKIVIKEVIKEIIKEVPVETIVIKEVLVPQDCPACQVCSTCEVCQESPACPVSPSYDCPVCDTITEEPDEIEYSDLQIIAEDIPEEITLGSPTTGGSTFQLAEFKYLGGRDIEVRRISFTTNGNPQFYNLKICGLSCGGIGLPVFGNNGSYYWEGSQSIDKTHSLIVEVLKQSCREEFNNCGCEAVLMDIDLADWIIWDMSTDKQVKINGEVTITGAYSAGCSSM